MSDGFLGSNLSPVGEDSVRGPLTMCDGWGRFHGGYGQTESCYNNCGGKEERIGLL